MTIKITDNLGNYAEASDDGGSAEDSAGVAVATLLKDSPDCNVVLVTRVTSEGDALKAMQKVVDDANKEMGWGS
jgi:hypothetical protein